MPSLCRGLPRLCDSTLLLLPGWCGAGPRSVVLRLPLCAAGLPLPGAAGGMAGQRGADPPARGLQQGGAMQGERAAAAGCSGEDTKDGMQCVQAQGVLCGGWASLFG